MEKNIQAKDANENMSMDVSMDTNEVSPSSPHRIALDFTLDDAESRSALISRQLAELGREPTPRELDLITNYLIAGTVNGELDSLARSARRSSRASSPNILSLDSLSSDSSLDSSPDTPFSPPANLFGAPLSTPSLPSPQPSFSRDSVPPRYYRDLWARIDNLDRLLRLASGATLDPPPTPKEQSLASRLTPYRMRQLHLLLIDWRREQYTIRDFTNPPLTSHSPCQSKWFDQGDSSLSFEAAPLGFITKSTALLFEEPWRLYPHPLPIPQSPTIDFTNPIHVYTLNEMRDELEQEAIGQPESLIPQLFATFDFYASKTDLTDEQLLILKLKRLHYSNHFIARTITTQFARTHHDSYISTIYTQQICASIAATAQLHLDTVRAQGIPRNFKQCKDCGATLLRDPRNFARSSRSSDGWNCRCKRCEAKKRKEANNGH